MSQNNSIDPIHLVAQKAIQSWQVGESSGNYSEFKTLLSADFDLFSHPMVGRFSGNVAKEKLLLLIKNREETPNSLTFSELQLTINPYYAMASFTSKGKVVGGKYDYEGHNVIQFKIDAGKVKGFCEYLGDDDLLRFSAKQVEISQDVASKKVDKLIEDQVNIQIEIQKLTDEAAIRSLANQFSDAANRKDGELFQSLWAPDGQWLIGAPVNMEYIGK